MTDKLKKVLDILDELKKVAPSAITFQKSIYKKYNSRTNMSYSNKRSTVGTSYFDDSIVLHNDDGTILSISKDYDEDGRIFIPEFNEIDFNVSEGCTSFLLYEGYDDRDIYGEYCPKTKMLHYISLDDTLTYKINSKDDVEAALLQLMTCMSVTVSADEVWTIISVLNDFYSIRPLRGKRIKFHMDIRDIKIKDIPQMVIPDEL